MSDLTLAQALIYLWTLTLVAMVLATLAVAFVAYLIVRMLNPTIPKNAPVPSFGTVRERVFAAMNGYPQPDKDEKEAESEVASPPKVTQVAHMADNQAQQDREQWWQERRDAGLTDDEIAAEELSNVVDLGNA